MEKIINIHIKKLPEGIYLAKPFMPRFYLDTIYAILKTTYR